MQRLNVRQRLCSSSSYASCYATARFGGGVGNNSTPLYRVSGSAGWGCSIKQVDTGHKQNNVRQLRCQLLCQPLCQLLCQLLCQPLYQLLCQLLHLLLRCRPVCFLPHCLRPSGVSSAGWGCSIKQVRTGNR